MDVERVLDATAQLSTPVAVVDIDQARRNITVASQAARAAALALFPHVKSHKMLALAREQLAAGAAGLTCQTVGEAELMAALSPPEIMIPVPVAGRASIGRLARLAHRVRISTVVGDIGSARELDDAARRAGAEIGVFIELDTGYHRCGHSVTALKSLAGGLGRMSHLRLEGILTYEGHVYARRDGALQRARAAYEQIVAAADEIRAMGIKLERVSIGASAGRPVVRDHPRLTEARRGSAALGDLTQVEVSAMRESQCAYGVVATVIARPSRGGFVIDAGAKALSYTQSIEGNHYGRIVGAGGTYSIDRLADEQGMCDTVEDVPSIGARVLVLPTAHAASIDCFDTALLSSADGCRPVLVDARGAR
ncbi:alanine racemase [Kribbella solani]|uniref:alanine racemase n=1 Tax=Kribbella solani TaxID=236067 RepID=UPI0029A95889|nr:alanine racemase [Kribbella solani]MDX3006556.1 alanine racemase [Kribbella solani]